MAVDRSDKKAIADVVLPEVHFNVTSTGVTISSKRLSTARFVPFNQPGKCGNCKSSDLELDHVITKEGITLYCSRIKGSKFIAFDHTYEYPEHCFFRLKSRGHVYNIPHGQQVAVLQQESQKRPSDQQAIDDQFIQPKQIKQAEPIDSNDADPLVPLNSLPNDPEIEFLYEVPPTSTDAADKENTKPSSGGEDESDTNGQEGDSMVENAEVMSSSIHE